MSYAKKHSLSEEKRPASLRAVRGSLQRFVSSVTSDPHDLTMGQRSGSDRVSAEECQEKGLQRGSTQQLVEDLHGSCLKYFKHSRYAYKKIRVN